MTLEERIVNELKAERAAVPTPVRERVPQSSSPWPRRLVVLTAAFVLVVGGGLLVDRLSRSTPAADGPNEVALGPLVVPVTGGKASVGGVTMEVAAPAPPLDPTVELPGREVPLEQEDLPGPAALPNDTDGVMVYLGTVAGQAVVLHDDHPPVGGIGEEVGALFERIQNGPMFCANSDGCSTATGEPLLGLGASRSGEGPWIVTATGFDLPPDTAAVLVTIGSGDAYWQRPAGNSITIRWEQTEEPLRPHTFLGLDRMGNELFEHSFD